MKFDFLADIRQRNPLIHNITNIVAANFSANGLLAIGASPFMSVVHEEMHDIAELADALLINLGGLSIAEVNAMLLAGQRMNQLGKAIVLDPVGAGATPYRQRKVHELLEKIQFSLIRGNAGEIAFLAGIDWQSKGVDAGQGDTAQLAHIARQCAKKYQCIVAVSGEIDYISDGKRVFAIANGTPLFPKITASGCLLGSICAAFLAVAEPKNYFNATLSACACYAIAGQIVAETLRPTEYGQFHVRLLDQLAQIQQQDIDQYLNLSQVATA